MMAIAASTTIRSASGASGERRVQVVAPLVVLDQLRERVGLPQHAVDHLDHGVLVGVPQRAQPRPQRAHRVQLARSPRRDPVHPQACDEPVQRGDVGQLARRPVASVLTSAAAAVSATSVS